MMDFEEAKPGHVKFVWKRLREMDRKELALFNMTDANYQKRVFEDSDFQAVIRLGGEPAGICGATIMGNAIQVYFFGTEKVPRHFKDVHRMAKNALIALQANYPEKRISVRVWEEYDASVRWLEKLGFVDGRLTIGKPGERLKYMIWKNGISVKGGQ